MADALRVIASAVLRAAAGAPPDPPALERVVRAVQRDLAASELRGCTLRLYIASEPTSERAARAREIRQAVAAGRSLRAVAVSFGVSTRQVRRYVSGK